ncbi:MAG: VWA domain-containing protein, partial [Treponema sp.]|nr:VWA domain-containing protein [Treponema sp.]
MIPNQFNFSTSILDIINSGITFDYPSVLYILLLLVALVPFAAVRWRKSRESAAFFAAAAATAMKVAAGERLSILKQMRVRMLASDVLFILFAAFLVIALASPRWGYRMVPEFRRGIDIVLAFDLSRSMDIRDVQDIRDAELESGRSVSRIERAVGIARELVVAIGDDVRIGTAIGRGRGVLAVPLTYDSEVALSFLHSLDGTGITGRGTNLESIVDAAAASFQDTIPSRRVIILFTDGDELSGSFQQAAERARRAGIVLSA